METKSLENIFHLDQRVSHAFERLMKSAFPRPLKKHQLVLTLLTECAKCSRRELESRVMSYFATTYERRTEVEFRRHFRIEPYSWLMQQFDLNFSNVAVTETAAAKVATHLRFHFKLVLEPPEEINSVAFIHHVVYRTVNPRWDQPNSGIDLSTFGARWRKESATRFGERFEDFFERLDERLARSTKEDAPTPPAQVVNLESASTFDSKFTQTDLDWMKDIVTAIGAGNQVPLYPLARGPLGLTLLRMEQLIRVAHQGYPRRYLALEQALVRVCGECMGMFGQKEAS